MGLGLLWFWCDCTGCGLGLLTDVVRVTFYIVNGVLCVITLIIICCLRFGLRVCVLWCVLMNDGLGLWVCVLGVWVVLIVGLFVWLRVFMWHVLHVVDWFW